MGIRLFSKITTQRYNYDYSRNDKFNQSFIIKLLKPNIYKEYIANIQKK